MKSLRLFALFICLISVVSALPFPQPGGDKGKGKAKQTTPPPSPPPSRPNTPTPEHDPTVPLPGRSGHHVDPHTGTVTTYYGDDHLPEHMGHLQRNQAAHPHNRNPMHLNAQAESHNRDAALHNIPTAGPHHVTKVDRVRDEKMPNFMDNPHHSTSTTVEYLPRPESNKEGGLLKGTREHAEKLGDKAKVRLRPNPGWLPLHPDQRRGHEAPARLNSQTFRPGTPTAPKPKKEAHKGNAEASTSSKVHEGYTPTAGDKTLRHRAGKPAPPPPAPPKPKKDPHGPSNLKPGFHSPPGHVWRPTGGSHRGAPGHLPGAEQRHPPRPQNHDHYMRQQAAAHGAHHKPGSSPAPKSGGHSKDPKHAANLAKFNKQFPPKPHTAHTAQAGTGRPRAHEAPARMMTHPHTHRPAAHPAHGNAHAGTSNHGTHPQPSKSRSPSPAPHKKNGKK